MSLGDAAFSRGDIMRRLAALERELQQLRSARRLESATIGEGGLTVKGGTIRITSAGDLVINEGGDIEIKDGGSLAVSGGGDVTVSQGGSVVIRGFGEVKSWNFNGDLANGNPGTDGWALGSNRLALLGALAVPVDFHSAFDSGNNFSFGGTDGPVNDKVTVIIPVPDWADEAGVMVFNMISARNDSASSDLLNGRSIVDGIFGQQFSKGVAVGEIFDVSLGQAEHITVSGRSSFTVKSRVWSGGNLWPANTANNSALSILVVFRSAG